VARDIRLSLIVRLTLGVGVLVFAGLSLSTAVATYRSERLSALSDEHLTWGRVVVARDTVERALALTPGNAQRHFDAAHIDASIFLHRGSDDAALRAVASLHTAIELNPLAAEYRAELGWLHMRIGEYSEASVAFEQALDLDPNNSYFLGSLGVLRERQGRYDDAADLYRRALAIMPDEEIAELLQRLESSR